MGNLLGLPPDQRPSAIYLLAHQGPLKRPVPIEIQHMRIRRYMDLLNQENHVKYHANDTDHVYVDFNYLGSGQFPALMRLGEAIGQKVYRAVFADFHGPYGSPTERESLVFSARHILEQLPIEFIDVNDDPKGVLKKRLEQS